MLTFRGLPVGTVLTVSEICAAQTSQYGAKEISPGAAAFRLNSDDVPGIRAIRGSSPLAAEKIGDEIAEVNS